jgi:hypothetical protein
MAAYYTMAASRMGFGALTTPLPVVNVPAGATVARIRSRPTEFILVYLRRPDRSFECWYCDFTADGAALRLTTLCGANHRAHL